MFTDSLYREVRRIIIASVLHTDMSHHFKMVSQMEVFYELHSEGIAANTRRVKRGIMVDCIYKKEEDRQFLLNVILHAADISNPVKPLDNYGKWSDRVIKEFFEQGDVERELGLTVSPMMDSATVNLAMSQINFIEFVVAPLYAVFGRLFPETSTTLARLVNNRMHYQALLEMELDDDDFSVSAASQTLVQTKIIPRIRVVTPAKGRRARSAYGRRRRCAPGSGVWWRSTG